MQKAHGALRMGCCLEDRPLVVGQHRKPRLQIRSVVRTWLELWRDAFNDSTITNVHISSVMDNEIHSSIMETSKYISKPAELLELSLKQLSEYLAAVKGLRLWSSGGCLKIVEQEPESDSDLIHAADSEPVDACPVCGAHLQPIDWEWQNGIYKPLPYMLSWDNLSRKYKRKKKP